MSRQDRFSDARWRVGAVAAGAVGGLAYIAQIIVGYQLPTWIKITLTCGGAILLFFSIALPNWQVGVETRRREAAQAMAADAVADYDVKVHKILVPLSGLLAKIVAEKDLDRCRALQEKLKQFVVDSALENMHDIDPRSCFYAYSNHAAPNLTPAPRLVLDGVWRGRNTPPKEEYRRGDDEANEAFRILESGKARFVSDTDAEHQLGWARGSDFKTYIHAAVVSGDIPFGLLWVDAVNPGDLGDAHKRLVELLAQLLGCGLGVANLKTSAATRRRSTT
ncbi:GAF domain-containing protein [Actinophytocola sp.]|uniref:GAF domain-containing protein n=1 Tax=Actinophytocola sp. TaxID=1872138 RepID=UPI002D80BCC0|nr:GAF domain-containing protein [Actinophytocola sp.]HET9141944.1 GAF domain-containing protein [Actinophytocola sp.]